MERTARSDPVEDRDAVGVAIRGLTWALLLTVLAALLVTGIPGFFGFGTVRVMGASMGRQVPIGSIAIVRQVPAADVRVGNVILFAPGRAKVATLHRVVRLERHEDGITYATTRGDANRSADAEPRAMRGNGAVLVTAVPFVGYVATMLQRPLLWFAVLFLTAVQTLVPHGARRRRPSSCSPAGVAIAATS